VVHAVVCDDYEPILRLIEVVLKGMGILATVTQEGCEALDLVRKLRPGLIISDVDMPGLDGISLFKEVQSDSCELAGTPFILMSSVDGKWEALEAGCHYFLTKPFSIEDLKDTVHQSLIPIRSGYVVYGGTLG
jgi:CheY-like chemotaxis protein